LATGGALHAQTTGNLQGVVLDDDTDEPAMFVAVALLKDSTVMVEQSTTDMNGKFSFSNIEVGTYILVFEQTGYPTKKVKGVPIQPGEITKIDVTISSSVKIEETTVYVDPIINFDEPQKIDLDKEFIQRSPEQGIGELQSAKATVNTPDAGEKAKGPGRIDGNIVLVDGVLTPSASINPLDIEHMSVMTTGIPVRYGNVTGVITNIITKGPTSKFRGGLRFETSQFLDNFGENEANVFLSGPIVTKPLFKATGEAVTDKDGNQRKAVVLGYRFSGTYFTTRDNRPSALSTFRLKDAKLDDILKNPLLTNPSGSGYVLAADFLTEDDLEKTNVRSNARSSYAQYSAKIDYKPNENMFLTLGSSGQFNWGTNAAVDNQLFNYRFNPLRQSNVWRVSARFRHTLASTKPKYEEAEEENFVEPFFQNFTYELEANYNETNFKVEDPRYKERFWEYGYVGKFYESRRPVFGAVDSVAVVNSTFDTVGWNVQTGHQAFFNSFDKYAPNWDINPGLAAYNNHIAQPNTYGADGQLIGTFNPDAPTSINEMEIINGLNVGGRNNAYGLFNTPHLNESSFRKSKTAQIRGAVRAYFDLVMNRKSRSAIKHQIELGGVFEQRIERSYSMNPFSLWNLAYQSTNTHISNATDPSRPTGQTFFDPITQRQYDLYESLIRTDEFDQEVPMTTFGANLRDALGKSKRDWVSVHEIDPSEMDLAWFEPTTLITGRQRVLNYFGYDYLGNPTGTNITFNEFFTATDDKGNKTRPIAPNNPIYAAGYIQDKFTFKNINCRIGVRFDSYDANTSVLKDPYSLTGYETAQEFESAASLYSQGQSAEYNRPSNIGDDYAVYVNANNTDATVVGYRNDEQWYNASGLPVNTASELGSAFMPALKGMGTSQIDPQGENYNPNDAFRDYQPKVVVMPRISLSFPITKMAGFYASYDVLAQRPPVGAYASPYDYYNFRAIVSGGGVLNNPDLQPERTVNYEVGYQQALTEHSKIKLSMLYREDRDMIQLRQYINAFPVTYTTYGNDDFATTKAFTLEYELRRHKKSNLQILANYTLQFSEGTGSNPTSSAGVAARELKNVFPINEDQRHTFYATIDYRFKNGDDYNGPKIGKVDLLANTGLAVTLNANSGRPYTRKMIAGGIGTSFENRITEGSINGARKPWNFRVSLRLDRDFVIGPKTKNPLRLNVYLRIQNLFNTQNVLNVYPTTGSPTDDGFLDTHGSPGVGFAASQPDSYQMLYQLREANPYNISRPRRIFVGANFYF